MTAEARKAAELEAKIASIGGELKFWIDASEANRPFQKHYSQIRRVARPIEKAAGKLAADLAASVAAGNVLTDARKLEQLIIDLHSVWEFFRAKLLMRTAAPLQTFLTIADEFAWACYEPAVLKIDPLRKEPPLAYFQSDTFPIALPRDHPYRWSVTNARLRSDDAVNLLKALPIPVISVPWFQSRHLPDLLIVAHEVGHHVEELGLTNDLRDAVAGAAIDRAHRAAWDSWKGEVFADVFATLATGPAFTTALIDFLTTARATITTEVRQGPKWTDYPTAYLRLLVSCETLRNRGFTNEADVLEQSWRQTFPQHAMNAWEHDCQVIAKALIDHGYLGGTLKLTDVATFDAVNHRHAVQSADEALHARAVGAVDVRELVAAAALAFSVSPSTFDKPIQNISPQDRIAARTAASSKSGTRSGAKHRGPEVVRDAKALDDASGDDLYDRLLKLR